ncbi:phosphatidate cytidylyltransferase [Candidatus Woesearchaeota archaeon]|nr:phosphatidate cytidylyltransferase [Candidatus Woesearchaeota archaeon]
MVWTIKQELGRKAVHITSLLIVILYLWLFPLSQKLALFLLAILLVVVIEIEYFRIETRMKNKLLSFMNKYKRTKETHHLGGDAFFLIGAIIALAIYDLWIAVIAILMTTFGDLVASLVGKTLGKHKLFRHPKKSWEGSIAEFFTNVLIGLLVVGPLTKAYPLLEKTLPDKVLVIPIILVMATTATLVEVAVDKLDDNLIIPLFAGFNAQVLVLLLSLTITVS